MKKIIFGIFALVFYGCISDSQVGPPKRAGFIGFLDGYTTGYSDSLQAGFYLISLIDLSQCSVDNNCIRKEIDSVTDITGSHLDTTWIVSTFDLEHRLYVQSSVFESRRTDPVYKKLFDATRIPSRFKSPDSVHGAFGQVFDESEKCMNIEQPEKDTTLINGTQVILDRVHTPCMPYIYESEMKHK